MFLKAVRPTIQRLYICENAKKTYRHDLSQIIVKLREFSQMFEYNLRKIAKTHEILQKKTHNSSQYIFAFLQMYGLWMISLTAFRMLVHEMHMITSTGHRGGRSGVRVYKAGRSPDETKRDEMKRSENERTKRKE